MKSMQITWFEMKKALFSPTILILLVLFTAFNIFTIIVDSSAIKNELTIVNSIVDTYGNKFNHQTLNKMQGDLNAAVQSFDSQYNDASTFLESMSDEKYYAASLEKQQEIDHIALMQKYISIGSSLDSRYADLDVSELKMDSIKHDRLTGFGAKLIENQYDLLIERLDRIIETEEYKEWFFAGDYRMHSELFRTVIKNIAIQGVMLVVLLTAMITNYEYERKTQLVIFAAKKGRQLMINKLVASLFATLIVLVPLFGLALAIFFTVYDYSGLWQTNISSGFNWEYQLPYITWWPIEFWQYLILTIVILTGILLIISGLTFSLSTFIRNSYVTWILSILLFISMFIASGFFKGIWVYIAHLNLSVLLLNPHMYFNGVSNYMMFKHQEIYTLMLWFLIGVVFCTFTFKRFARKDIV